ncbi:MAG: hypothetical protein WDZ45_08705 [Flavobacteriaceae bacterium]
MENDINEALKLKANEFIEALSNKTESERLLFHYNSVLNFSNRIIFYNDEKAIILKEKFLDYFQEIEELNYTINHKYESSRLFNNYLLPILYYLIEKEFFVPGSNLKLYIIIGFLADFSLYYFISGYYYPVFLLLFIVFGFYKRIKAKKEGKYAAMFW